MTSRLWHQIDHVYERVPFSSSPERWTKFLVESCGFIAGHLPIVGQGALSIAREFLEGGGTAEDVKRAKNACWAYLDSLPTEVRVKDRGAIAVRALVMALYPFDCENDDDGLDVLGLFVGFVHAVEDVEERELSLLRTLFPEAAAPE